MIVLWPDFEMFSMGSCVLQRVALLGNGGTYRRQGPEEESDHRGYALEGDPQTPASSFLLSFCNLYEVNGFLLLLVSMEMYSASTSLK